MTKELVDSLLQSNTSNRRARETVVDAYARDMTAGKWMVTHQGIAISEDNVLIDGQHRLLALRKAGYPKIEMLVVYGLPFEIQKYVDQQAKRSIRDVLKISFDSVFTRHAPAIARQIFAEASGYSFTPTASEVIDVIADYMDDITLITDAIGSSRFFAASHLAAFVKAAHDYPEKKQDIVDFVKSVEEGSMLSNKSPAFHLRNFTINSKGMSGGSSAKKTRFAKTAKAIEFHLNEQKIGVLKV